MRVGWFGYGGHAWQAEQIREALKSNNIDLITCHEHENADVKYTVSGIFDFVDSCDAIFLPVRYELEPAKSVNRLALAWSRSKACVVYPLPAYLKYAKDGENSLVVSNPDEAVTAFLKLRDDNELLLRLGASGKKVAESCLSPIDLIFSLKRELEKNNNSIFKDVCLQVIIPHYSPKYSYLLRCVRSLIHADLPQQVDIHIVSSSSVDPTANLISSGLLGPLRKGLTIRCTYLKERTSFSRANNVAIKAALPSATHFLFLNDDTIVSRLALVGYFNALDGRDIILNPYSNCDQGWLHSDRLTVSCGERYLDLHPGMDECQVNDYVASLEEFNPGKDDKSVHVAPFCAMYATLVPNIILRSVGLLSTEFINGGEDADYSYRAQKLGYQTCWTKAAFVFHYGGKTRKVSEEENPHRHLKEDNHNNTLLFKKWPRQANTKRLAIWTGPAWEKWGLDSYLRGGIGGSETCAARLAMTAAENGYNVTMIGEHDTNYDAKITTVNWKDTDFESELFDTVIASRSLYPIDWRLKSKKILVWIHDIWLLSGKEINEYHRRRVDKFITLSPWHRSFVKQHHNLEDNKIVVVPNGVNTELFEGLSPDKEWGRLHYSSSPDRGLDNILAILPWVLEKCPDIKLHLFYGFYNWESSARSHNDEFALRQIENMKNQIASLGDRVVSYGRISQPDLAKEWMKAWLWLYPTQFSETFCLTAKEAQISGTPILCSDVGALNTTVGEYGIRVAQHPYTREGRQEYIDQLCKIYADMGYWQHWQKKAYEGANRISWGDIWTDYWSKLIV